jgi:hypothetical protein
MDMKAMKLSRKAGSGPLVMKFPFVEHKGADDVEEESTEDLPMVLSQEIIEAGDESMFFSGNLLSNFLNATGGSSFTSPALPLLGIAFQHLLPSELREVKLPTPLSIDAINALPRRPPLPSGAGFITVSAETQAEVLCRFPYRSIFYSMHSFILTPLISSSPTAVGAPLTSTSEGPPRIMARWPSARWAHYWMQVHHSHFPNQITTHVSLVDGVQVQFLELEDIAADPDGLSIQGEKSDEIIYHRSQAEAGDRFNDAAL